MTYTFLVARFMQIDGFEFDFVSVGRYRDGAAAHAQAALALEHVARVGLWPTHYRQAEVEAESIDDVIGEAPALFPPGAFVQLMDGERRLELDVITAEPTGRRFDLEHREMVGPNRAERRHAARRRRRRPG